MSEVIPWIILLLPLGAAAMITLGTRGNPVLSSRLSIGAVLTAFVLTLVLVVSGGWTPLKREVMVTWLDIGDLQVDMGLRLDPLSLMMLLVVTGVGSGIHIYSAGYMAGDKGYARYFACLSLFTFSMLGIVLANNFLMMFVFWELVGVSSYLLIGFWFEKSSAAEACKKAFLCNRLGDFGFLLGILFVWASVGALNFSIVQDELKKNPQVFGALATAVGLLLFCGAMGKSAQFPLHVWLPDAMEGPTPVSALIHAATMVAAGVYMLCRIFFVLDLPGSHALEVITWIGAGTALMAALIAVQQNDIKRILAYSTLSQLGYMVMAVGVAGTVPAMYHLTTHAFFKALLFLGAGSVIHALHHEQDIWKMGGLAKSMPVTFKTFLVGTLALCGVPPLSGFFSKDEVLASALDSTRGGPILFSVAALVAVLTTLYMTRLFLVAFLGKPRSEAAHHAHESPALMTAPLVVLAVLSAVGGYLGIEKVYAIQLGHPHLEHAALAQITSVGAVLFGFSIAFAFYRRAESDPFPGMLGFLSTAMSRRFYFDELYEATVVRLQEVLAVIADWIDRWIIAGLLVRGVHGTTELVGRLLRLLQSGSIQTYTFLFVFGLAIVLVMVLARG